MAKITKRERGTPTEKLCSRLLHNCGLTRGSSCSSVALNLHVVVLVPLNIRNKQTEELAAALAKLTGETKTEAVTQALRERIGRVRQARAKRRLADELDGIAKHCATLPVLDRRTADEILGYDECGIPR